MSFVKNAFAVCVLALSFTLSLSVLAEGDPFKISGPIPEDKPGTYANELKHEAVTRWLKNHLKEKYAEVEEQVTPEFTEKYILDFSQRRFASGEKVHLEVSGHLDADALDKWSKRVSMNSETPAYNPLYILSSDFPSNEINPQQTATRVADNIYARTLTQVVSQSMKHSGMSLNIMNLFSLPALQPVRTKEKLEALEQISLAAGSKTALWFNLSSCYQCGGAKIEMYLYRFEPARVALTDSADLKLSQSDLTNAETLKTVLTPAVERFRTLIDSAISKGTLIDSSLKLVIRGLPFTKHREIEQALAKLKFVGSVVPQAVTSDAAQFEVTTKLNVQEFSQRIGRAQFADFNMKVLRVDSNTLIMRYWKTQG